jgi:hypothetical protein
MTRTWKRLTRRMAPMLLALGLALTPAMTTTVRAQEPATPEGGAKSEGRPLDGYLGTITVMLLVLFVVGKSARR